MFIKRLFSSIFENHAENNDQCKKAYIKQVPEELMLQIFSNLPQADLCAARLVCKEWRRLAGDEALWQAVCENLGLAKEENLNGISWHDYASAHGEMRGCFEKGRILERQPYISYIKSEEDQKYIQQQIEAKDARSLPRSFIIKCLSEKFSISGGYHQINHAGYFPDERVNGPYIAIYLKGTNEMLQFDLPDGYIRGLALEHNILAIHMEHSTESFAPSFTLHLLDIKKMLESKEVINQREAAQIPENQGKMVRHRLDFSQMNGYVSKYAFQDNSTNWSTYVGPTFGPVYYFGWVGYGFYFSAKYELLNGDNPVMIIQEWNFSNQNAHLTSREK